MVNPTDRICPRNQLQDTIWKRRRSGREINISVSSIWKPFIDDEQLPRKLKLDKFETEFQKVLNLMNKKDNPTPRFRKLR